jgi:ubiquinone/menaquinone biosynthesis C-methylase UbiE
MGDEIRDQKSEVSVRISDSAFPVPIPILRTMAAMDDEFTQFEHEGWERVADKYDSVWSKSTRQFIPYLLDAAEVLSGMSLLDVGCGPGYVSAAAVQRGAFPSGLDFSREMVAIARKMFPGIEFREGDAQNLFYNDATFDRVLANFALLHLSDPERACAEAFRVLKPGGKFGFTVWAPPPVNPYAKIMDDALEAHADLNVKLPPGPPHYLYSGKEEFRKAMERAGFDGASMTFAIHTVEWIVPSARFPFDAEREAGVRTAGLLARQTPEKLSAIQSAIEKAIGRYAKEGGFAIPKAAYVIAVSKQ